MPILKNKSEEESWKQYFLKLYEANSTPWNLIQKDAPSSTASDCFSTGCHQNHVIAWQAASASLTPGIHYLECQRCVIKGDAVFCSKQNSLLNSEWACRALCTLSHHPIASHAWDGVLSSVSGYESWEERAAVSLHTLCTQEARNKESLNDLCAKFWNLCLCKRKRS